MRVQQVPNSPYFIHYDDDGYCSVSRDKDDKEPIPESEMQMFLDAVANGLLYIEKERKHWRMSGNRTNITGPVVFEMGMKFSMN